MIQAILIIFGAIWLLQGEYTIFGKRKIYEPHGRMLAGFLLLAGIFGFIPTFGRLFAIMFFYAALYVGYKYSKTQADEEAQDKAKNSFE